MQVLQGGGGSQACVSRRRRKRGRLGEQEEKEEGGKREERDLLDRFLSVWDISVSDIRSVSVGDCVACA
eukprot:3924898-Rhodomonas_salina.1